MGISCIWSPKDQICIAADLCQLNKLLEQGKYHIPTIDEMLSRIDGFNYATGIVLNMGYMALCLDAHALSILRMIFLFGIFKYQVLPMGIKPATDIFQARMTSLFASMQDDDVLICSNTFEKHMAILSKFLGNLPRLGCKSTQKSQNGASKKLHSLDILLHQQDTNPCNHMSKLS